MQARMNPPSPELPLRERRTPAADSAETATSRKKLLLISQYFPWEAGGAEHQVYCLAKYLRSKMDVYYLTASNRRQESAEPGIQVFTIPKWRLARKILGRCYVLDYFRVQNVIRRIHPDVIYTRGATTYLAIAARYARSSDCTLIWHIASEGDVRGFQLRSLRTILFDYIDNKLAEYGIRHASCIFGQARYEDELLRRNYGRRCDLIIGNWHPEPAPLPAKGPPIRVVWVANLKPLKRPEIFADLAERLGDLASVEFVMIGRPGPARYQRRLAPRLQGVKNLRYLGERPIEEVNRILAASHLLVNTSDYEGFPNTFVQAWLHEVPVVSLHVDPDGVLRTEGLGLHSGSFDQLVRDTRRLIAEADLRARMGRRARTYALEKHSLRNLNQVAEFLGVWRQRRRREPG